MCAALRTQFQYNRLPISCKLINILLYCDISDLQNQVNDRAPWLVDVAAFSIYGIIVSSDQLKWI